MPTDRDLSPAPTLTEARDRAQAALAAARLPDGAWPYLPGGPAAPEPTVLAVGAGQPVPTRWLSETDLGWAQLALPLALGTKEEPLKNAVLETILTLEGTTSETAGDFDGFLVGWPWVPATFSWVEPTAWALASLQACGHKDHPRVAEGLAMLADRQCADGGWNAGNPSMLGQELPGYLYLTGIVCLALPAGHQSLPAARRFLAGVQQRPSALNLSTALLAHLAHGWPSEALVPLLLAEQHADGSFGRCDRTAWAVAALTAASGQSSPLLGAHRPS
jgi:hypothetical protein